MAPRRAAGQPGRLAARPRPGTTPSTWSGGVPARTRWPAARRSRRADDGRVGAPTTGSALLFACCHPALAPEARLALTLRAVVGLTTPQIARAFLVNERTLAQRIVRAKRKIVAAGIALTVPPTSALTERLADVLAVVALMYNEGFVSSTGPTQDRDLAADAVWLAGVVATSLPREAEAWGLAALLTFQHARAAARFSDARRPGAAAATRTAPGGTAPRSPRARRCSSGPRRCTRPGPFQLQAAIAACHATSPSWAETDWLQIVTLYDVLARHDPSPVVRLNRAVALAQLGPAAGRAALADVDALADRLDGYHLFHATRAELLTALGRDDEADAANARALALTANDAERRLLTTRLHRHPLTTVVGPGDASRASTSPELSGPSATGGGVRRSTAPRSSTSGVLTEAGAALMASKTVSSPWSSSHLASRRSRRSRTSREEVGCPVDATSPSTHRRRTRRR